MGADSAHGIFLKCHFSATVVAFAESFFHDPAEVFEADFCADLWALADILFIDEPLADRAAGGGDDTGDLLGLAEFGEDFVLGHVFHVNLGQALGVLLDVAYRTFAALDNPVDIEFSLNLNCQCAEQDVKRILPLIFSNSAAWL